MVTNLEAAIDSAGIGVTATAAGTSIQITSSIAGTSGNNIIVQTGSGASITTTHLTLEGGKSGTGDKAFTLKTIGQGSVFNTSTGAAVAPAQYSDGSLKTGSLDNLRWEVSGVNEDAGTFNLSIRRGDDNTKNKIILETFIGCSLDP